MGELPLDRDGVTSNQDDLVAAHIAGVTHRTARAARDGAVAQALDGPAIAPWMG